MKAGKLFAIVLGGYVGIVVAFESLIGFFQPAGEDTLVITTTDEDGNTNDRVLARLESSGKLYVAANHWPRAWYNQALKNPDGICPESRRKRNGVTFRVDTTSRP